MGDQPNEREDDEPESAEPRASSDAGEGAAASGPHPAGASVSKDLERLRRLRDLTSGTVIVRGLSDEDLLELPRLYRHACSVVARLEASGQNPRLAAEARHMIARAHGILYGRREHRAEGIVARIVRLYLVDVPRRVRAEWRLLATSLALVYGLAFVAWYAVSNDLDLAPSLLSPGVVEGEIQQLEALADGEPFRGNFTFGIGESPTTAGLLMLHNIGIGLLFFASALLPPVYLYLLSTNALMLGTYTAVAGHWGEAGAISSILWCHGVLEIQAIVLAGTAGLCLVRAWIKPGRWTRRHALQLESRRALLLFAPTVPMLVCAGVIEAFVSPHAPFAVRMAVAVASGIALVGWLGFAGRSSAGDAALA